MFNNMFLVGNEMFLFVKDMFLFVNDMFLFVSDVFLFVRSADWGGGGGGGEGGGEGGGREGGEGQKRVVRCPGHHSDDIVRTHHSSLSSSSRLKQ